VTIKYNPDGSAAWTNRYDGPVAGADAANFLAFDKAENIYVTGRSQNSHGGSAYATIKYRSDGTAMWTNRYVSPANLFDLVQGMAVTPAGAVIVAGYSQNARGGYDYLIFQLSQADNQPPALLSITQMSSSVRLRAGGFPGQSYEVQRSLDLDTWTTLFTGPASSTGILDYEDAAPPIGGAFYRLAVP
jgi:hypothetical protein